MSFSQGPCENVCYACGMGEKVEGTSRSKAAQAMSRGSGTGTQACAAQSASKGTVLQGEKKGLHMLSIFHGGHRVRGLALVRWAPHAKGYQEDAAVNTPRTWSQRPCCCCLGRPGPAKNRRALRSSSLTTAARLLPGPSLLLSPPHFPHRQDPGF